MTNTTTSGAADLPEALTVAVDCWFAKNTGLGGCSDKDVRELADIFRLHALAAGQATAAQVVVAAGPTPELQRMTTSRASFFMERFLHEEKLLGPNEQAALQFVISMLSAQPATEPGSKVKLN